MDGRKLLTIDLEMLLEKASLMSKKIKA
jgi:hypothetical protein